MLFIDRPTEARERALVTWQDGFIALSLMMGVPASFLTPRQRWVLCNTIARVTPSGRHTQRDRARMQRLGDLTATEAERVDRLLRASRVAANFNVMRTLMRGPDVRVVGSGFELLSAAVAAGRGAVLWVSDFAGAGDVTKIALAQAGHRVNHLSRIEHGFSESWFGIRYLNPLRIRLELRYLNERVVFDRMHPSTAMLHLARHLRANGVVTIAAGAQEGRTIVEAGFLRGTLGLATGAPRLAVMVGAPIFPVFTMPRSGDPGIFDVSIGAPLALPPTVPEDEQVMAAAAEYLDRLEAHVRQRPECWVGWRRAEYFTDARGGGEGPGRAIAASAG